MRRIAALMTLYLLLQWTLGGAVRGCEAGGRSTGHAAMSAMPQHASHDTTGHHGSCDGHGGMSADAQCVMAVGCAASAALLPAPATDARIVAARAVPSFLSAAPPSWHARPEIPPPRA